MEEGVQWTRGGGSKARECDFFLHTATGTFGILTDGSVALRAAGRENVV